MSSLAQTSGEAAAVPQPRLDFSIVRAAITTTFLRLSPAYLRRRRTLLVVEGAAVLATVVLVKDILERLHTVRFDVTVTLLLWLGLLCGVFGEAVAQARGKAHADALRKARGEIFARRKCGDTVEWISASRLREGEVVVVEAGEFIPADGFVIDGIALVDESAITGESAPVIRESGRGLNQVSGGTRVLSDHLEVKVIAAPGETLVDRMTNSVESAERERTPGEIAAGRLIGGWTVGTLLSVLVLSPFLIYAVVGIGPLSPVIVLAGLAVCLVPLTIASLLPVIGIAGLDRVMRGGVLATHPAAVEAAADVDIALLDKTGTMTVGDRGAVEFVTLPGVSEDELGRAAYLSSIADDTPEGRSTLAIAKDRYRFDASGISPEAEHFVPFSAYTRMSGVDLHGEIIRKGAAAAIADFVRAQGGTVPNVYQTKADAIARTGGTPLGVADGPRLLGIIHLKDVVKPGMKERISQLIGMGVRPVMITGDNPVTTEAIARECGFAEFLPQATPADKLAYIKREQAKGLIVAMTGDGTNDAPALAQADVGLAMNTGTLAAKEAGNMVDLDSNPTKLIEVVRVARQVHLTRSALAAFSMSSSIAKFLLFLVIILPDDYFVFKHTAYLRPMSLRATIVAALVFSIACVLALLPVAMEGIAYQGGAQKDWLKRYRFLFGTLGLLLPIPCIWLLERAVYALHLI